MSRGSHRVILLLATLLCSAGFSYGQAGRRTLAGTVSDQEGRALAGVSVLVPEEEEKAVQTDRNGHYMISVPEVAEQLQFSLPGMLELVEDISGRSIIDVRLAEDTLVSEGDVLVAPGVLRPSLSLTSRVWSGDSTAFVTREANLLTGLYGKIPGLQSAPSQYLLDGIPLDSVQDLNQEDIAAVGALVGPSASALYSPHAADGVLMLSTRSAGEGLRATYTGTASYSMPLQYCQRRSAFGSREGEYAALAYTTSHVVSLFTGGRQLSNYFSAGYTRWEGITPYNGYDRANVTLHPTAHLLGNKLHLSLLGMYMHTYEQESRDLVTSRNLARFQKDRFLAGGSLRWDATPWLSLNARARTDNAYISDTLFVRRESFFAPDELKTTRNFADVLADFHRQWGRDRQLAVNAVLGGSWEKNPLFGTDYSAFGNLNVGLWGLFFLEGSAREDWITGHKPLFSPSAGASLVLTEIGKWKNPVLNLFKLRGSYANTGLPMQRTSSWEAGADLAFAMNRLRLSGTYYQAGTTFEGYGIMENRGLDISGTFKLDIGDFNWTADISWVRNLSRVASWTSPYERIGGTSGASVWLVEGRPAGELYVAGLKTNADGTPYVTPSADGGVMHREPNDGTPDTMQYAGNVNPDWTASWRNRFSWRNWSLDFLFTWIKGGTGVSLTQAAMDGMGLSPRAVAAGNGGFYAAPAGVTGPERDRYLVSFRQYWDTIAGLTPEDALGAFYLYDLSHLRLSELSLGYYLQIPDISWLDGIHLSLVGRNLALLFCQAPFDPAQGAIDLYQLPSSRNVGFSIKVNFAHHE